MTWEESREPFVKQTCENGAVIVTLKRWMDMYPWISAGFSTRLGGVSAKPRHSMNVALHVDDNDADVIENRTRLAAAAGFAFRSWTCAEQVHGNDVEAVSRSTAGAGRLSRADAIAAKDGLITNEPGVMLTAFYADCVPLWFVDPDHQAVGIAHAGWRGTAADVAGETVRAMAKTYGSDPSRLRAAIGPSIRGCCYEVDERVIREVRAIGDQTDESIAASDSPGRYMLDLAKLNVHSMRKAGILADRIELSGYCTGCRTDLFFSHRMERGQTGRMAAWIARKEEVTQFR